MMRYFIEHPSVIWRQYRDKTSTKFVQKLRELNKGKHIQRTFEYLMISKNVKLFFLAIIILNVNSLHY